MITGLLSAIGLFIATNIDDIIVLSLFLPAGRGKKGPRFGFWLVSTSASWASSRPQSWSRWGQEHSYLLRRSRTSD